jgi:hypothetical protein
LYSSSKPCNVKSIVVYETDDPVVMTVYHVGAFRV